MGLDGLEPSTSRLSGARSSQLSYRPQLKPDRQQLPKFKERKALLGLSKPNSKSRAELRDVDLVRPIGVACYAEA